MIRDNSIISALLIRYLYPHLSASFLHDKMQFYVYVYVCVLV